MADENLKKLPIPDIWYDFIARLVPGFVFVLTVRFIYLADHSVLDAPALIALGGLGYAAGLFMNPLGSSLATGLERRAAKGAKTEVDPVTVAMYLLEPESREGLILSKMRSEVVFFAQCTFFSVLYLGLDLIRAGASSVPWWHPTLLFVISLWFAWLAAARRLHRADKAIEAMATSTVREPAPPLTQSDPPPKRSPDVDKALYDNANKYRLHQDTIRWTLLGGYAAFLTAVLSLAKDNAPAPEITIAVFAIGVCYMFVLGVENFFYNLFSEYAKDCERSLASNIPLRTLNEFSGVEAPKIGPFHHSYFFALLVVLVGNCAMAWRLEAHRYSLVAVAVALFVLLLVGWRHIVYPQIVRRFQHLFDLPL